MLTEFPNPAQLQVLLAIVEEGSTIAAARVAHLTQPAVSQSVSSLEKTLHSTLFQRSSRGMVPTAAGRACALRAARAVEQLKGGVAEVRQAGGGRQGGSLRGISSAQLEALLAIVREGGFGRAARSRGIARATLHRSARQLERVVDVPLFETTSHGTRPTREAERLARRVELAISEMRQCRAELAALRGHDRGKTVIGSMPLARSLIVPSVVAEFAVHRPHHAVSIQEGPYEVMINALRAGGIDLMVGALREDPLSDVHQEHLFDDPLAILARTDHPLARSAGDRQAVPSAGRLSEYPWIIARRGSPLRHAFDRLMAGADPGARAAPVECGSWVVARSILASTDRLMLLSAHQACREIAAGELVALPHPHGHVTRPIGLTTRRDWRPTSAQLELVDCVRKHARAASCGQTAVGR